MSKDNVNKSTLAKKTWRTPRIMRLLSGTSAAGTMVTSAIGTPQEGKLVVSVVETLANFLGGPS